MEFVAHEQSKKVSKKIILGSQMRRESPHYRNVAVAKQKAESTVLSQDDVTVEGGGADSGTARRSANLGARNYYFSVDIRSARQNTRHAPFARQRAGQGFTIYDTAP